MGRADQTTKVRGMFVHASQVAEVLARHPEVGRARLVVSGEMTDDRLLLRAEVQGAPEGLATRLAEAVRDITRLRSEVELVPPGGLPNDGRVIEDARTYR
jgi:phenylacetate-CoA ligase